MRYALPLCLLALLLFAPTTVADWGWGGDNKVKESETFDQTYDASADAPVRVETTNGHIEIETWDRDEIRVYAEKKAHARDRSAALELLEATTLRIDEVAGGLTIEVDRPESSWRRKRGNVSVNFRLTVPRGASIDAHSTNGAIEISDVRGDVVAETTNGGIHLDGVGGDAAIETTNGQIKAYGVGGSLDARTTNGGIDAEVLASSLSDDMRLSTTNGSVDLALSGSLAATVKARAGNGRVDNRIEGVADHGSGNRRSASFDMNGGGPRIDVSTTNGRIRLTEAD